MEGHMDYKKMYFTLLAETAKAIELLQEAQRKAENIYIETSDESVLTLVPKNEQHKKDSN